MSKIYLMVICIILLLPFQVSSDQQEESQSVMSALEITGFMDFVSSYHSSTADKTDISVGQAEIDLSKNISQSNSVEVAIAYNNDESKFELGAAFMDIHFTKNISDRHVRKSFFTHTSLLIGIFDVPFGIDYNSYASVDRKLISVPRVVDLTHEGWNDVGFNLNLENRHGSLSLFIVNGFESSAEISTQVINIATGLLDNSIEEIDTTPSNAFGGRIGFSLFPNLEIGTSGAIGLNADSKEEMTLVGADLQYNVNNLLIKGEYISHSINRSIQEENNKGYYLQSLYDFESFYVTSRYGSFKPDGVEWVGQLSIGGGVEISDGTEVRVESIIHESTANNTTMLQFVTEF